MIQQILWLDVSVDDVLAVQVEKGLGHLLDVVRTFIFAVAPVRLAWVRQ